MRPYKLARTIAVALAALSASTGFVGQVSAQDYVTSTRVYLRRSPSSNGARLRVLQPGDSLTARPVTPKPGWLPVRTTDGKAGWVGELYVRSLSATGTSTTTLLVTAATGHAFTRIDSTWAKPPIVRSTIMVQDGALSCGPTGDAADDDGTNLNKNRDDVPAVSHIVTVDAIRSLPDTILWRFTNRTKWRPGDSAVVLPYEGTPLTVEGYFEIVKPQATTPPSGEKKVGESPNCHSWAEADTDWHIALVADPSETEDRAVVVEPTPRTKRNNPGWDPKAVAKLAVRRTPTSPRDEPAAARVRVTGFLMLDPVHPAHIAGKCTANCAGKKFYRATLWELHPVTRIEVLRNGEWVDLNAPEPP